MGLKEPKSMAEIHAIRKKLDTKMKGMTIRQKLVWINRHAKMLGIPPAEATKQLKKAS
jgi:hypothetical protein